MCAEVRGGVGMSSIPSPKEIDKPLHSFETVAGTVDKAMPRLIFLSGTSTAGKTSIMREFTRSTPKSIELGVDDFEELRTASLIKTHCPEEYAILSQALEDKDIHRFLFSPPDFIKANPQLFFKPASTAFQREAIIKLNDSAEFFPKVSTLLQSYKPTQDSEHFETILTHSEKGVSVIFDTPNEKGLLEHLSKKPHTIRFERFLVYVPLFDLINRLPRRNEESLRTGNWPNQRQNIDLLNQFKQTYRKANPGESVIDVISREGIQKIFAEKREEIERENASSRENGRSTYAVEEEQFLEYFGLSAPGSEVPITTISDYKMFDGIFHTATQTPTVSVGELTSHSWKRL